MTIEEIFNSKALSVRSYNICNNNLLRDLSAILKHYSEYKTFSNIRNCGTRSNEELIEFCLNNIQKDSLDSTNTENLEIKDKYSQIISRYTRSQREVVNSFLEYNINNLSNRSKNIMYNLLNCNLKVNNFYDKILKNSNFRFKDVKNSGLRTELELSQLLKKVKKFIEEIFNNNNLNEIKAIKNKFFIEKIFPSYKFNKETLDFSSVFKIVDFLIIKNIIFQKHTSTVFISSFKLHTNQSTLTTSEIAKELNITNERVRQLRKTFLIRIFDHFQFLKYIDDDFSEKYGIDINQNHIKISDDINWKINYSNQTNFSIEFNSFLIYLVYSESLVLLGNIEDVLQVKSYNGVKHRHKWYRFYLINKVVSNVFDFNAFVNDISSRLLEKIEETYSFHFETYLLNFYKIENNNFKSEIARIAEEILFEEFELVIEQDESLHFKQNTIKLVPQYAIEALEKLGIPSKIENIYYLLEKDYPDITKSIEALRGTLNRTPEFIYFGRSSTYGLKKWEIEKEGIKGGTIKDIVYDYLIEKNGPIHITELLYEVHRFRNKTNAKNIITNLKLDPQKKFVIFSQSFVGLSNKNYDTTLTKLPKFLGRNIKLYIKNSKSIKRYNVENYFSKKLKISKENISYILDQLIADNYIFINSQNNIQI